MSKNKYVFDPKEPRAELPRTPMSIMLDGLQPADVAEYTLADNLKWRKDMVKRLLIGGSDE